ncbi:growth arrest-specific protein 2-like [Saccoglossus kowalevskii]
MDGDHNDDPSLAMSQEIAASAQASLAPLREDLADWLSKLIDIEVTGENFFESLCTGVLPCKLAAVIQKKAEECQKSGAISEELPKLKIKCRQNASVGSFFARDNTANFLAWCKEYGVPEACLFESEGLVLLKQPKDVLVCIYELARIASKYGIEPPGLVKLEKEIEQEEEKRPVSASKTPGKKVRPKTAAERLDQEIRQMSSKCKCSELDIYLYQNMPVADSRFPQRSS